MKNQDNLGDWVEAARNQLSSHSTRPMAEAYLLAAHILKKKAPYIVAHPETELSKPQINALQDLLQRYLLGEPLPYLLGHWEFFGLDFIVTPNVLIPRPETEMLVEHALDWLITHANPNCVLDIGTGSGCIAVSLTRRLPELSVIAVDRSFSALRCAAANAKKHHVDHQVHFVQTNLMDALGCSVDMICANLPYIPSQKLENLLVARHEPLLALDGGPDGLVLIRSLLIDAKRLLSPRGVMLLEIEAGQKDSVLDISKALFPSFTVEVISDFNGKPRLLLIQPR